MAEPLTGKGIGIAMYASMMAIPTIKRALQNDNYSKVFLKSFETEINKKFRAEWKKLDFLSKVARHPRVVSFMIKIGSLPLLRNWMTLSMSRTYIKYIGNVNRAKK
jgi:flavin-dependent dehydrogenase